MLDFASCILEVEEVVFSTVTQVVINDVNDVSLLFKRPSKPWHDPEPKFCYVHLYPYFNTSTCTLLSRWVPCASFQRLQTCLRGVIHYREHHAVSKLFYSCVLMLLKDLHISVCSCAAGKLRHLGLSSGLPNSVAITCCLSYKKKKSPARQMINKQTGLETDDVELAAAPRWKHVMRKSSSGKLPKAEFGSLKNTYDSAWMRNLSSELRVKTWRHPRLRQEVVPEETIKHPWLLNPCMKVRISV